MSPEVPAPVKITMKETNEAFIGIMEVALLLAVRFSDGLGMDDASAIWDKFKHDEDFKAKMNAAYDGWKKIPEELKDIDLKEGLELAVMAIAFVPKFIDEIKKAKGVA